MKELKKRLALYNKMLKGYTNATKWYYRMFYDRFHNKFASGFCLYLGDNYFLHNLHELFKQKPLKSIYGSFWFKKGELQSRIECLKQAILLTEEKIKEEEDIRKGREDGN